MNGLEVHETGAERDGRDVSTVAVGRLLALFGVPRTAFAPEPDSALGDALFACARALDLALVVPVLASARVVDRDDASLGIGDVVDAGLLEDVTGWARRKPRGVVVVADAAESPRDSMAERLREALGEGSRVRGVTTLADAMEVLFDVGARARAGTLVPTDRREAARRALFESALQTRIRHPWQLVRELAIGLGRHADLDDAQASFELNFVRDVAARHSGFSTALAWPEDDVLEAYDRPRKLTIAAHIVQSASDGALPSVTEYVAKAVGLVGAGEVRIPEELILLGAVGRALAAVGDYEAARRALSRAVRGWLATDPTDASHALCELLRVEGIAGTSKNVERLRDHELAKVLRAEPGTGPRAYLMLALGRALAQVGRSSEALDCLTRGDIGPRAPVHVRASALRWRAKASRLLGDGAGLKNALAQLDALGPTDQRELARLDEDLDVPAIVECLESMVAVPGLGDEASRLLERLAPGASLRAVAERPDVLHRLRAEYRY